MRGVDRIVVRLLTVLTLCVVGCFSSCTPDHPAVASRGQAHDAPNEIRRNVADAVGRTARRLREVGEWHDGRFGALAQGLPESHERFVAWLSTVASKSWRVYVTDGERASFFIEDSRRRPASERLAILVERATGGGDPSLGAPIGFDPRGWLQKYVLDCDAARKRVDLLPIGEASAEGAVAPVLRRAVKDGLRQEYEKSLSASRIGALTGLVGDAGRWLGVGSLVSDLTKLQNKLERTLTDAAKRVLEHTEAATRTQALARLRKSRRQAEKMKAKQAGLATKILAGLRRRYRGLGGALSDNDARETWDRPVIEAWGRVVDDALLLYKLSETAADVAVVVPSLPAGIRPLLHVIPNGSRNVKAEVGVSAIDLVNLIPDEDGTLRVLRRGAAELVLAMRDADALADLLSRGAFIPSASVIPELAELPTAERRVELGAVTAGVVWRLESSEIEIPRPVTRRRLALDPVHSERVLASPLQANAERTREVLAGLGMPDYAGVMRATVEPADTGPRLALRLFAPGLPEGRSHLDCALEIADLADRRKARTFLERHARAALAAAVRGIDARAKDEGLTLGFLPRFGNDAVLVRRLSLESTNPLRLAGHAITTGDAPAGVDFDAVRGADGFAVQRLVVAETAAVGLAARLAGATWKSPSDLQTSQAELAAKHGEVDRAMTRVARELSSQILAHCEGAGLEDLADSLRGSLARRMRDKLRSGLEDGATAEVRRKRDALLAKSGESTETRLVREALWQALTASDAADRARRVVGGLENLIVPDAARLELEDKDPTKLGAATAKLRGFRQALEASWANSAKAGAAALEAKIRAQLQARLPLIDASIRSVASGVIAPLQADLVRELTPLLGRLDPDGSSRAAQSVVKALVLGRVRGVIAAAMGSPVEKTQDAAKAESRRMALLVDYFAALAKDFDEGPLGKALGDWHGKAVAARAGLLPKPEALRDLVTQALGELDAPVDLDGFLEVAGLEEFCQAVVMRHTPKLPWPAQPSEGLAAIRARIEAARKAATQDLVSRHVAPLATTLEQLGDRSRRGLGVLARRLGRAEGELQELLSRDLPVAATTLGQPLAELEAALVEHGFSVRFVAAPAKHAAVVALLKNAPRLKDALSGSMDSLLRRVARDLDAVASELSMTPSGLVKSLREAGAVLDPESIRQRFAHTDLIAGRFAIVSGAVTRESLAVVKELRVEYLDLARGLRKSLESADQRWRDVRADLSQKIDAGPFRDAEQALGRCVRSLQDSASLTEGAAKQLVDDLRLLVSDRTRVFEGDARATLRDALDKAKAALDTDALRVDAKKLVAAAKESLGELEKSKQQFAEAREWLDAQQAAAKQLSVRLRSVVASPVALSREVAQSLQPVRLRLDRALDGARLREFADGLDQVRTVRRVVDEARATIDERAAVLMTDVSTKLKEGAEGVDAGRKALDAAKLQARQTLGKAYARIESGRRAFARCEALLNRVEHDALAASEQALERLQELAKGTVALTRDSVETFVSDLTELVESETAVLRAQTEEATKKTEEALRTFAADARTALREARGDAAGVLALAKEKRKELEAHLPAIDQAHKWAGAQVERFKNLPKEVLSATTVDAFLRDVRELAKDRAGVLRRQVEGVEGDVKARIEAERAALGKWVEETKAALDVKETRKRVREFERLARERIRALAAHKDALRRTTEWIGATRDELKAKAKAIADLALPIDKAALEHWEKTIGEFGDDTLKRVVDESALADLKKQIGDLKTRFGEWKELAKEGEDALRRKLRATSAELAVELNVPITEFKCIEGEVVAILGDTKASIGKFEDLAKMKLEEVKNHVETRVKDQIQPVLDQLEGARESIETGAKKLLESKKQALDRSIEELLPKQVVLLGYRCDVILDRKGTGLRAIVRHGDREKTPDYFELMGAFEVSLENGQPRLQFKGGAELPIPNLREPLARALGALLPGLELHGVPTLRDRRLHLAARYRPDSFPFEVAADLVLDFADLSQPRVSLSFEQNVRAAIVTGFNELLEELADEGRLPGVGPVQVEAGRVVDLPRGFGCELDVALTAYDPITVPLQVRVLPGAGLKVRVDERAFGSALSQAMNAWLGDTLPFGLELDDPAFQLEGGIRVFLRYHVDIPIFGAGLGGRLSVSADGIRMDSALTVKIPLWIDAPPVSFGGMAVTLDLRKKAVRLTGKVAISPGAATQYILCAQITGELKIKPLELRARGDLFLAGGLLSLAETEMVLKPREGSFRCTMSGGGFAGDLLQLEGELRIEILDDRRIVVDGKKANVYTKASLDVLGARLAEVEAGLGFDLSLWAKVEADLPLAAAYAKLGFDAGLKNPSLRFRARLGDDGKLANIRVFVHADTRFVAADARAIALGVEIGVYLEFAGLGDLLPWRIVEELLAAIDFGLNPPKALSISLTNADKGEVPKENDEDPDSPSIPDRPPVDPPPQPQAIGGWKPAWHYEVEIKRVKRSKKGLFGVFGNKTWTETIRIVHTRTVPPLRSTFGLDGTHYKSVAMYYRQKHDHLLVVDNRGSLRVYERRGGRWGQAWTGRTDKHKNLTVEPLFARDGLAFFYYVNGSSQAVLALPEGSDLFVGKPPESATAKFDELPNNCSAVEVAAETVLASAGKPAKVADDVFQTQLWILARLRLNAIPVSTVRRLGDQPVFYLESPAANLVCVQTVETRRAEPQSILLRDRTGGAGKFVVSEAYRTQLQRFSEALTRLAADESRMELPAWGHLFGKSTTGQIDRLVVMRGTGRSGQAVMVSPLVETPAKGEKPPAIPSGELRLLGDAEPLEDFTKFLASMSDGDPGKEFGKARGQLFDLLGDKAQPPMYMAVNRDKQLGVRIALAVGHPRRGGAGAAEAVPSYGLVAPVRLEPGKGDWLRDRETLRTYFSSHAYYLPAGAKPEVIDDHQRIVEMLARGDWRARGWKVNPTGRLR